jgi:hypothetical protein
MATTSQVRALKNYRKRLSKRGMARFEVLGLDSDRELVRTFARRLAENDAAAAEIRAAVREKIAPAVRKKGGILEMLRSAPPGFADLDLTRPFVEGRKVDL